jgi:hypothetical protein
MALKGKGKSATRASMLKTRVVTKKLTKKIQTAVQAL